MKAPPACPRRRLDKCSDNLKESDFQKLVLNGGVATVVGACYLGKGVLIDLENPDNWKSGGVDSYYTEDRDVIRFCELLTQTFLHQAGFRLEPFTIDSIRYWIEQFTKKNDEAHEADDYFSNKDRVEPVSGGKEYVTPEDIDALIEYNRELMQKHGQHHRANRAMLDNILIRGLEQYRKIANRRDRVLCMAAWILYKMSKGEDDVRPFFNGNKRTATIMAIKFLNWNGYDVPLELLNIQEEKHRLLTAVQHNERDYNDVLAFLKRCVTTF